MFSKICHYSGIVLCLLIIMACFLPWVHINSINETFTGFYVKKFSTNNYYGRSGRVISIASLIILLFFLIPKIWAKRINLFLSALLFAYCIRTYVIFTGSLFEGDIENRIGIYLILIFSFLIMICSVFPKIDVKGSSK